MTATIDHDISFDCDGLTLQATLTAPDGAGTYPGVLLLPGSGSLDRNGPNDSSPDSRGRYRDWAETLAMAGFASFRFDRGNVCHPDHDIQRLDRNRMIEDAQRALTVFGSFSGVDSNSLFILGHSEGGDLAPAVARGPTPISGLILINSLAFPTEASLALVQTPKLIIQSLADDNKPAECLTRNLSAWQRIARNLPDVQLVELSDHNQRGMKPDQSQASGVMMTRIIEWITQSISTN